MDDGAEFSGDEIAIEDLTWREQEVLLLLAERLSNGEIAERLHLAETTVKDYVGKILSKLYVKNRRQAVERARELGLLDQAGPVDARPAQALPTPTTPFIGRTDELLNVQAQLGHSRLVTVTGPGGMGKTRLTLEVARAVQDDFGGGAYFVSLAPIQSSALMPYAIAEAIGLPLATQDEPLDQLLHYLSDKQVLLVLDNFEHVVDGAITVSDMLRAAPDVKILASSRERLNIQGESLLNLAGLGVPDDATIEDALAYDSVQLFVHSARRIVPSFEFDEEAQAQIVQICMMVQGMPLAIELAAAWLNVLTLGEIVGELEHSFRILESQWQDVPERHRSIRAVIDSSWSRMTADEQAMFMRLSVFKDGFTRQAAAKVTGGGLQTLVSLVNKSLVRHNTDTGRFEMHELLSQYAQEQLDADAEASQDTHRVHATYYADLMQALWAHLKDSRQIAALNEIEQDLENIRSAWKWSLVQRDVSQMRRFLYSFWMVYWVRGWYRAGMELFREGVSVLSGLPDDGEVPVTLGLAMGFQAYFMSWLGLADEGLVIARRSIEILDRVEEPVEEELLCALNSLSVLTGYANEHEMEMDTVNRMLDIAEHHGDLWWQAFSRFAASIAQLRQVDTVSALDNAQSSQMLFEEIGNSIGTTLAFTALGAIAMMNGEYEAARDYYQRYLDGASRTNFRWAMVNSQKYLGRALLALNDIEAAEAHFMRGLRMAKETSYVRDVINLVVGMADVRAAQGQLEEAVALCVLVIAHPVSLQNWSGEATTIRGYATGLAEDLARRLPADRYEAAVKRGQAMQLESTASALLQAYEDSGAG